MNWDNENFNKHLGDQNFKNSIQSWIEQRNYTMMAIKVCYYIYNIKVHL